MAEHVIVMDDTLRGELDAFGEAYWRWATRDGDNPLAWESGSWPLKGLATTIRDLIAATVSDAAVNGLDLAARTMDWFGDNRPDMPLSQCMGKALAELVKRAETDARDFAFDHACNYVRRSDPLSPDGEDYAGWYVAQYAPDGFSPVDLPAHPDAYPKWLASRG